MFIWQDLCIGCVPLSAYVHYCISISSWHYQIRFSNRWVCRPWAVGTRKAAAALGHSMQQLDFWHPDSAEEWGQSLMRTWWQQPPLSAPPVWMSGLIQILIPTIWTNRIDAAQGAAAPSPDGCMAELTHCNFYLRCWDYSTRGHLLQATAV